MKFMPFSLLAAFAAAGVSHAAGTPSREILTPDLLPQWKMAGPGSFENAEGTATARGGMGLWWFSEKELRNFTVELEFKWDDPKWNSGIFVRFPDPGNDPWVAVRQGYELQVCGTKVTNKHSGAVYDIQAPALLPEIKNGEWNRYKITCAGPWIAAFINGTLVNVFRCQPGRGDEKGYFGLQNHDDGSPVAFRNVTLKEWPDGISLLEAFTLDGVPRSQLIRHNAARWPAQKPAKDKKAKSKDDWYRIADHGPAFYQTYGDWLGGKYRENSALKGVLLSYSPDPRQVALFNTETLAFISATDQGTSLDNTPWGGKHGQQNKLLNKESSLFVNDDGPGWADAGGSFDDQRPHKPHGNLAYAKYNGHFRHGERIILDYTVHGTRILDSVSEHPKGLVRYLEAAPRRKPLVTRLSVVTEGFSGVAVFGDGAELTDQNDQYLLTLPPSDKTTRHAILYPGESGSTALAPVALSPLCRGGTPLYPETFTVKGKVASGKDPWLVDTIPLPPVLKDSPYRNDVRVSDFDFFSGGDRAALCTWDGDVWIVSGLKEFGDMTWKRFATGLFEPLGLLIVDGVIHVSARDAVWKLHDLNDDLECDHYEVFNNDVLITNNFHEFSFGLENDPDGNFIFAKAGPVKPGGRGFDKFLPHNGAVLRLSKDGSTLEVIATGVRAPGGIGVGPKGEITTGENEGTWQPVCKLNYFTPGQIPAFLGVEDLAHDLKGKPLHEPICYFPHNTDNSGGGQTWVPSHAKIGLHPGELLHLSYGKSSLNRVLTQRTSDGNLQGGIVKLPLKLQSSAQRAEFHPDGSLYVVGMRGWQTNAATPAAFHRIRYQDQAVNPLPDALSVSKAGISIRFEVELDEELATDPSSYTIKKWKYIRGPQYGSGEFSIDDPDTEMEAVALQKETKKHKVHDKVKVTSAKLQADGKTVLLECENLTTAQQMVIDYDLESADGDLLIGSIVHTIHELR